MPAMLTPLILLVNDLDPSPQPADVKAGWGAFALFLGLLAVIALLGWSLARHLRQVERNRRAGVFGDPPEVEVSRSTDDSTRHA